MSDTCRQCGEVPGAGKGLMKYARTVETLIDERDAAEEAVSQAYYIVTGHSPEWSNNFGHAEAHEEISNAVSVLKQAAKENATQSARIAALEDALRSERITNAAAVLHLRTWGDPQSAAESMRLDEETRLLAIRIKDGPANPPEVKL